MTKSERDCLARKARYAANPDLKRRDNSRAAARQKARYANDHAYRAARIAAAQRRKRFDLKKITEQEFLDQLQAQQYRCAGCETVLDRSTGCIDHDHATGTFRGVLCRGCNLMIPHTATPQLLRRLADYMEMR